MTQQYEPLQPSPQPPSYGQQPQYPAQQGYQQPPAPRPERRNGFAITAVALSLVGLVFCLMPITGFVGFAAGLLALLFALLSLGRVRRGVASKGLTIAGLVLAVLTVIAGFASMKTFFDILEGIGHSASPPAAVSGAAPQAAPAGGGAAAPQDFTAGQTITRDGMQITAAPLRKVKQQYGDGLVCSKVTYKNTGDKAGSFNEFDWKIQNPAGVQGIATMAQKGGLQSGQLAPGGTVTGDVCTTDPGAKGDYLIINDQTFSDPIQWKAAL